MTKKKQAFAKGFAQGFVPWAFVIVPQHATPAPRVKIGTAWIQAGQSLRSALDTYGRTGAGGDEKAESKEPA
jgi:hypothetical protein